MISGFVGFLEKRKHGLRSSESCGVDWICWLIDKLVREYYKKLHVLHKKKEISTLFKQTNITILVFTNEQVIA